MNNTNNDGYNSSSSQNSSNKSYALGGGRSSSRSSTSRDGGGYGRSSEGSSFRSSSPRDSGGYGRSRFGGGRSSGSGRSSGGYRGGRGRSSGGGRTDHSLYIKKAVAPELSTFVPNHRFDQFGLDISLTNNLTSKGYQLPTPIQDEAIEKIIEGRDVIGLAATGTGKTGAFLIPLIHKCLVAKAEKKHHASLIVVPTRELAQQIEKELLSFTNGLGIYGLTCVGGTDLRTQLFKLKKPNHFIIGTPGRLMDLVSRRALHLGDFQAVVLDEVDRMLDMGFVEDITHLIHQLPPQRQSLFFSATLDRNIERIAQEFLRDPLTISVKTSNTSDNVEQDIIKLERGQDKVEVLSELLKKPEFSKVLIFSQTKHGVDRMADELYERGFHVETLHGDKTQSKRQRALKNFDQGRAQVLIATDVAARGLDINKITHVINLEIPQSYEDYVHRIGRTGRAGTTGIALTFVN